MPKAPAKKPVLKLRKSPTGTKHIVNRKSVKPIIGEGYFVELNKGTPKKGDWTPKQLERLKKVAQENLRVVGKRTDLDRQRYLLEDYKKEIQRQKRKGIPGYEIRANKPLQPFFNIPVADIIMDHKTGILLFKDQMGDRIIRITRHDLLDNNYYLQSGLISDILESRNIPNSMVYDMRKSSDLKKQKVIELVKFLGFKNLKDSGISLDTLKRCNFTLPEIVIYGSYSPKDLTRFYSEKEIRDAFSLAYKNSKQISKRLDPKIKE